MRRSLVAATFALRFTFALLCEWPIASSQAAEPSTPSYLFSTSRFGAVLGFDLRNEQTPIATVVINRGLGAQASAVDLALPFKVKQASTNEEALFRIGTFNQWTLVTYSDNNSLTWPQQISFFPVTDLTSDSPSQFSELRGSLYLQNQGQIWRFLYRYPDPTRPNILPDDFFRLPIRGFDAIAVALPANATRIEVRGKSAMPEHVDENQFARFYPPSPASPSEPFLDIEYILPPTPWQKLVLKNAAKITAAFSPLLGVLFAYLAKRRPRLRVAFMILTGLIYLCLLVLVVVFASGFGETGNDLIVDFTLLGVSAVVTLITLRYKPEEEEGAPTTRMTTPQPPPRPAAVVQPAAPQSRAS